MDIAELSSRVERLVAFDEIGQLKIAYSRACDAGPDADRIAALFVDDAVMDQAHWGKHQGREAIRAHFRGAKEIMPWSKHYITQQTIELSNDGRSATGEWNLWQPCTTQRDGERHAMWLTGTYRDKFVLTNEGWRFQELTFHVDIFSDFHEGWLDLTGARRS
jgi:uncharacterized protein (TIGR02246 family)